MSDLEHDYPLEQGEVHLIPGCKGSENRMHRN